MVSNRLIQVNDHLYFHEHSLDYLLFPQILDSGTQLLLAYQRADS